MLPIGIEPITYCLQNNALPIELRKLWIGWDSNPRYLSILIFKTNAISLSATYQRLKKESNLT